MGAGAEVELGARPLSGTGFCISEVEGRGWQGLGYKCRILQVMVVGWAWMGGDVGEAAWIGGGSM